MLFVVRVKFFLILLDRHFDGFGVETESACDVRDALAPRTFHVLVTSSDGLLRGAAWCCHVWLVEAAVWAQLRCAGWKQRLE